MSIVNKLTGSRMKIIDNTVGGTSGSRIPLLVKSYGGIDMETSGYAFVLTDTSTISGEPTKITSSCGIKLTNNSSVGGADGIIALNSNTDIKLTSSGSSSNVVQIGGSSATTELIGGSTNPLTLNSGLGTVKFTTSGAGEITLQFTSNNVKIATTGKITLDVGTGQYTESDNFKVTSATTSWTATDSTFATPKSYVDALSYLTTASTNSTITLTANVSGGGKTISGNYQGSNGITITGNTISAKNLEDKVDDAADKLDDAIDNLDTISDVATAAAATAGVAAAGATAAGIAAGIANAKADGTIGALTVAAPVLLAHTLALAALGIWTASISLALLFSGKKSAVGRNT